MLSLRQSMRSQLGAATIEAMSMMIMLLMCLMLVVFVGTAYYNINIMDSATQNMALSSATQMDRFCRDGNPNGPYCQQAKDQIASINNQIAGGVKSSLLLVDPAAVKFQAEKGVSDPEGGVDLYLPGQLGTSLPSGFDPKNNWQPRDGWGWAAVSMTAPMTFFWSNDSLLGVPQELSYTSKALGFSYKKKETG